MMKTKTIALAGVFLSAGIISPTLMASSDTVILIQNSYSYDVGGEFTAITDPSFTANYAADTVISTVAGTGFSTFCVETGVDFSPYNAPWNNQTPYNFTMSLNSEGPTDDFALSEGTAYLYSQFAQGILTGYDYADPSTRLADAGELQAAIWALQGGQTYGDGDYGTVASTEASNPFYLLAESQVPGGQYDAAATPSTDYGVEIMNLTDGNGNAAQNQLIYLGGGHGQDAPDNGATLALLALSVAGLAGFARRLPSVRRPL
jgi:hypothetical protein